MEVPDLVGERESNDERHDAGGTDGFPGGPARSPAIGDSAIGNDTPTADQAQDKAEADTADEAKEPEPFKVPAGYQAKQRGKKTVYCKKAMESGTRFSQEKCYSEETLRAMEASRNEDRRKWTRPARSAPAWRTAAAADLTGSGCGRSVRIRKFAADRCLREVRGRR